MMRMSLAALLALGLTAPVTAYEGVNTGKDREGAVAIGTIAESENVTGVSDTIEI